MSDKLCVYGAKVHIFSDIYKNKFELFTQKCIFLRLRSPFPSLSFCCQRPRRNQGRTKERPKNSETQKVHFIKIAISFISLIHCLVLPIELRETTERTPTQLPATKKCFFLRLFPNQVVLIPKIVDSIPETVDLHSSPLHPNSTP